jgi:hypothetical protein
MSKDVGCSRPVRSVVSCPWCLEAASCAIQLSRMTLVSKGGAEQGQADAVQDNESQQRGLPDSTRGAFAPPGQSSLETHLGRSHVQYVPTVVDKGV